MSDDSRPADATHKLFRELRFSPPRPSILPDEHDLDESISASILLIEKASKIVEGMHETVRLHEETIYNQNSEISHLNSQKEDALDKLLQLEDVCRREADKASKLEVQCKALNDRARVLEQRNADLTAQLDRMIKAVSKSFSNRAETEIFTKQLRVVL